MEEEFVFKDGRYAIKLQIEEHEEWIEQLNRDTIPGFSAQAAYATGMRDNAIAELHIREKQVVKLKSQLEILEKMEEK